MSDKLYFNYDNMITENLLAYPITRLIDESARQSGLDPNNPKRRLIAAGSGAFMSTFIGATLGGPLGFVMGLMGYCIGLSVKLDDYDREEEMLNSGLVAAKKLAKNIPDYLADEIGDTIIEYGRSHDLDGYSAEQGFKLVYSLIANIDIKAANLWIFYLVYELDSKGLRP